MLNAPGGAFVSKGSCPLGWEKALATVATSTPPEGVLFSSFGENSEGKIHVLFWEWSHLLLSTLVTIGEPTLGRHDVYLAGIPEGSMSGRL